MTEEKWTSSAIHGVNSKTGKYCGGNLREIALADYALKTKFECERCGENWIQEYTVV